jgi:hypothetical protein
MLINANRLPYAQEHLITKYGTLDMKLGTPLGTTSGTPLGTTSGTPLGTTSGTPLGSK